MTLPVCFRCGIFLLNMTPSGNRPFPSKKWGKGQISRDTCSTGNHLLEESKSHKTVSAPGISCWIQREGGGGGGGGAGAVAECLFSCSISLSHTHLHTYNM